MNYFRYKGYILLLINYIILLFNIHLISAQDPLIGIVSDELEREFARLKEENYPPYYLSYRIDEVYSTVIESTFGSLTQSDEYKGRILTATVRVGSYELDNTHELKKGYNLGNISHSHGTIFPVENDTQALKQVIWRVTDRAYKNAASSYSTIISSLKNDSVEDICDFSKEPAVNYYEPPDAKSGNEFDKAAWEEKIKKYSVPFLEEKSVLVAKALINYFNERKYFI